MERRGFGQDQGRKYGHNGEPRRDDRYSRNYSGEERRGKRWNGKKREVFR